MIDEELVLAHRSRCMTPDKPTIRGTSQNPDVFFQHRERDNKFYDACPDIIQKQMDKFAKLTGRQYQLFQYEGHPEAEHIIVLMGSACETVADTVNDLNKKGEKLGVIKVRVYRPFDVDRFVQIIPKTVKTISVLDRTKESTAIGEPLYIDVVAALNKLNCSCNIKIYGGRYGLSSKDFTPQMTKGVFDNAKSNNPKNSFTVGIEDDVTNRSLNYDCSYTPDHDKVFCAMFYGLGADGTVGANKNSIKIIGNSTDNYAQGYFVYDSKKSGAITTSHLRFGTEPIRAPYLISKSHFVACHQEAFLEKFNMTKNLIDNGVFLINSSADTKDV